MTRDPVLDISGLRTVFRINKRDLSAVQDLDLTIMAGETVALVGESGSGKSVTGLSIMGLLPKKVGRVAEGQVRFRGKSGTVADLTTLDDEELRQIRGNDIGMVDDDIDRAISLVVNDAIQSGAVRTALVNL